MLKRVGQQNHRRGFTVIEVCVVIIIIGILATIVAVGISSWRNRSAETEVKNDLNAVSAVMESARNFGNGYPMSLPSGFTASKNVTVTYASGDTTVYCIDGVSKVILSVHYFINTTVSNGASIKGTCATGAD